MDSKEVLVRAVKTFVQAFLAAMSTNIANVTNLSTLKAAVLSALAMAVSVVWNVAVPAVKR